MKTLIVGGTGLIGGAAALHLKEIGHEVTIAGRNPPSKTTPLSELPFERIDYVAMDFDAEKLAQFDAMVFCAGNDIRHQPRDVDDDYWYQANSVGIPRFFTAARDAGIKRAINIGSFYPQAAPRAVETSAYVRSRKEADDGITALATPDFAAMSINAPFVLGTVPGLVVPMFAAYTQYAQGKLAPMQEFVPPGGTNFISTTSLSEAIANALDHGEAGASYLVGDENLSFQDYFGAFFEAVGREKPPIIDQEHPMMPDATLYFGRGNSLFYDPDPETLAVLDYRRNDVFRTVKEIVAQYRDS